MFTLIGILAVSESDEPVALFLSPLLANNLMFSCITEIENHN